MSPVNQLILVCRSSCAQFLKDLINITLVQFAFGRCVVLKWVRMIRLDPLIILISNLKLLAMLITKGFSD